MVKKSLLWVVSSFFHCFDEIVLSSGMAKTLRGQFVSSVYFSWHSRINCVMIWSEGISPGAYRIEKGVRR